MREWLPVISVGVGIAAILLGLWNSFALADLTGKVTALQQMRASAPLARNESEARPTARPRASAASLQSARSLGRLDEGHRAQSDEFEGMDSPEAQARIESAVSAVEEKRDKERGERFVSAMRAEVEAFVEEEGISAPMAEKMFTVLERRTNTFRETKDAVRSGEMTLLEAKDELDSVRSETEAELDKLLGADRADRLDERLWADRRPPGP